MNHCSQRNCCEKTEMSVWGAGEKEWERKWDWQEVWRRWNKQGDGHQKGRCRERERGLEKWEGRKHGKVQWIVLSLWCRKTFPPLEKPVFLSLIFSCFSVHPARLRFPPSPRFCTLLAFLSVSMFYRSPLPSVYLSTSLTPSPRVFRWPLLSAFLLPLCSTCVLPGCISSSPASPKRYWNK